MKMRMFSLSNGEMYVVKPDGSMVKQEQLKLELG